MDTMGIIEEIDAEISRLQQAKVILSGTALSRRPGRPKTANVATKPVEVKLAKRVMSAEGKARIAAAQKARWAKVKKIANKPVVKKPTAKKVTYKKAVKAVKTTKPVKAVKAIKADKPETESKS
jgi:hypothetical protein